MYFYMYVLYAFIVYVCMHLCVCMYVYMYVYICMYVCVHTCMYAIFKLDFEWYGGIVLVGRGNCPGGIVRGKCPGNCPGGKCPGPGSKWSICIVAYMYLMRRQE